VAWLKGILVVANRHFVVADSHSNKEQVDALQPSVGAAISRGKGNNVRCNERQLFKA